eukprot:g10379.t2
MAQTDREALVALYNATDGPSWIGRTNWGSGTPLSDWHGVKANDQGRVVELSLGANNLRGTIPPELGKLTAVQGLHLYENQLSGPIPPVLGELRELRELYLHSNQLTGLIPPELGNLVVLRELYLSSNKLSGGIPLELGKLEALEKLYLSDNQLSGHIPKKLGALSKLKRLWLKGNGLTGPIPPELGDLRELRELYLYNIQLTGPIPKELGALTKLEQLWLHGNGLTDTIPPELGKLIALQRLSLSRNQLSGPIPKELGALSKLQQLWLHENRLTGQIPPQLGDLGALKYLYLNDNRLDGTIPPELGKLRELDGLSLGSNQLNGLWDILGQDNAESMAARPRALPVALASLLDMFDRFDGAVGLDLSRNPWEHPPEAIVMGGTLAVRRYFEDIFRGGATAVTRPLKVVIIGKETVGKTSLRRSIKAGKPCVTGEGGVDSTVHVDVEDHELDGHPIRLFDCAGQVVYYGLLQLFLTPRAVYLLVWDAAEASKMDLLNLEELAIAPWLSYQLALEMLEELASSSRREAEQQTRWITRANLEEKWQARVDELERAKTPVEAPGAAVAGAILIRRWEGGLVEYGSFIFLDVQWFATVLDPLFSHKRDAFGNLDLGGRKLNTESLDRLEDENVLEPQLAEELWGADLAPHLLLALKSAGLTFPLPKDPKRGLVVLLRMGIERPDDYSTKLNSQLGQADEARKHDLRLHVECFFPLGLPPGFLERLLARCCHLGFPHPFWRYGALIVGDGEEEGLFSLTLEYSEKNKTLTVEVFGGCTEVHAWAALSKVLSVTIKMLADFPGLPCKSKFLCPIHKDKGIRINMTDAQPGSPLVENSFCPLCTDRQAGKNLLAVALQVIEFSDEEFFDAQLCQQFAENAENVAVQGRTLWPGSNLEVSRAAPWQASPRSRAPQTSSQDSRTPWYQDFKTWVGASSGACLTVFGVSYDKEDDDPRLWGVFLGFGILLLVLEFVFIAKEYKLLCFTPRVEAASAGNDALV